MKRHDLSVAFTLVVCTEVLQLLDEHKRFSRMVGKMGKLGKGK
eukprot:COSAG01_NODE_1449_length_10271_cov_6.347976_2_plen_43_part_00